MRLLTNNMSYDNEAGFDFFFSNFTFANYTAGKVSEVFIYSIFTLTNLCKRPGCLTETKQVYVKKKSPR